MMLLSVTASAAVLILCILLLRAVLAQRLSAAFYRILWILTALRLLIFKAIPSPLSVFSFTNKTISSLTARETGGVWRAVIPLSEMAAFPDPGQSISVIFLVWIAGVTAVALFFLIPHLCFCRRLKCARAAEYKGHRLRISPHVTVPCVVGLFRPAVCLEKMPEEYPEGTLECILAHESAHIRRGDVFVKWMLAAAVTVHWFNPMVWCAYILANRDLEFACDDAALRALRADSAVRAQYASVLLDLSAAAHCASAAVGMLGVPAKNTTKERILRMIQPKKASRLLTVFAIGTVLAVTAVFAAAPIPSETTPEITSAPPYTSVVFPPSVYTEETTSPETPDEITLLFPLPQDSTWEITVPYGDTVRFPETTEEESPFYYLSRIPENGSDSQNTVRIVSYHDGIDIAAAECTPVLAVADGTVLEASYDYTRGNYLILDCGFGVIVEYRHLERFYAQAGDTVKAGDHIANLGYTGNATGPHLHFSLTVNGESADPMLYYKQIA